MIWCLSNLPAPRPCIIAHPKKTKSKIVNFLDGGKCPPSHRTHYYIDLITKFGVAVRRETGARYCIRWKLHCIGNPHFLVQVSMLGFLFHLYCPKKLKGSQLKNHVLRKMHLKLFISGSPLGAHILLKLNLYFRNMHQKFFQKKKNQNMYLWQTYDSNCF